MTDLRADGPLTLKRLTEIHADGFTAEDIRRIAKREPPDVKPRTLKGIIATGIVICALIIVATLMSGCAATLGHHNRTAGVGTAHGSGTDGEGAPAPPLRPALSTQSSNFPAAFVLGDQVVSVPLSPVDVQSWFSQVLANASTSAMSAPELSRGMSRPASAPVDLLANHAESDARTPKAQGASPEATSHPSSEERGTIVYVNPHGQKYHLYHDCQYVCSSGDHRDFCKGKPSSTMPIGLAIKQQRPLCITCAKRAGGPR